MRKGEYPHLQGLWFSDVNRKDEVLGIDLLIGLPLVVSKGENHTGGGRSASCRRNQPRVGSVRPNEGSS